MLQKYSMIKMIKKPDYCPLCECKRILQAEANGAPITNQRGGHLKKSEKFVYMCYDCHKVLGFVDDSPSPEDTIKAHERPDLSAKYMVHV